MCLYSYCSSSYLHCKNSSAILADFSCHQRQQRFSAVLAVKRNSYFSTLHLLSFQQPSLLKQQQKIAKVAYAFAKSTRSSLLDVQAVTCCFRKNVYNVLEIGNTVYTYTIKSNATYSKMQYQNYWSCLISSKWHL